MRPAAPTLDVPKPISRPALFRLLVAISRGGGLPGAIELLEADRAESRTLAALRRPPNRQG